MDFWSRVDKRGEDECWPWIGPLDKDGYGYHYPHRTAWSEVNGPIPEGLCILHTCDNPPCCNPCHLFCGTHADNVKDKVAKNRQSVGENSGTAILTVSEVEQIRTAYIPGVTTQEELASQFGVAQTTIGEIVRGCNWKSAGGIAQFENIRQKITRHERNGNSRLTLEQVKTIRETYAAGGVSQASLAVQYGVVQGHISRIILGQAWMEE